MRVATYLMVTVREVETGDVHARVEHLDQHLGVPAGWAQCANNFGLALVEINRLKDVLEADTS